MTKEQFDKLYLGKAIHCDTEEKANEFLALADSVGYRWSNKRELINYSQWETFGEETCYELTKWGFMFADVEYFKKGKYKIIEYQLEPTYKEETIDDIIEEIKEHQKSINVLLNRLERKTNEK